MSNRQRQFNHESTKPNPGPRERPLAIQNPVLIAGLWFAAIMVVAAALVGGVW